MTGLANLRVLVVEDEFLLAAALEDTLSDLGCEVLGPCPTVPAALNLIEADRPDIAVLDVNVRGEMIFRAADRLRELGVPFLFCTGYADMPLIPERFRTAVCLSKPCDPVSLTHAITREAQGISSARAPESGSSPAHPQAES